MSEHVQPPNASGNGAPFYKQWWVWVCVTVIVVVVCVCATVVALHSKSAASTPKANVPTLQSIARKCGDKIDIYKDDDGKLKLDAVDTSSVGTEVVDCVIEHGHLPSGMADDITMAEHDDTEKSGRKTANGYEYTWNVSPLGGVFGSNITVSIKQL